MERKETRLGTSFLLLVLIATLALISACGDSTKEAESNKNEEKPVSQAGNDGASEESGESVENNEEELEPPAKGADKRLAKTDSDLVEMLDKPDLKDGKLVNELKDKTEVTVIGCQKMSMSVGGKKGRWCKVKVDGKTGWVFDAYLVNFSQKKAKADKPKLKEGEDPQFKDYPATKPYKGKNAELVLDEVGKQYKSRLERALKSQKPSFAGKYIVASWGCGSGGCNTGAIIDAETGKAYLFPVSMSSVTQYDKNGSAVADHQEHEYQLTSSLMMFAGNLEGTDNSEGDDMVEYYEFKDGEFIFISSKPYGKSKSVN